MMRKDANVLFSTFFLLITTKRVFGQLSEVGGCWGGNAIFIRENEMKRDLKSPFTYKICPNTTISPGTEIRENGHAVGFEDNSFPIMLKSNARIQCGEDGDPANNCIVDGFGTYGLLLEPTQVLSKLGIWDLGRPNLKNVEIVGLTFQEFSVDGQRQTMVQLGATHGSLTFERCTFQSSSGSQPMFRMQQLIDVSKGKDLTVSFNSCKFEGLQLPVERKDGTANIKYDGGLYLLHFSGRRFAPGLPLDLANTKFNAIFDQTTFSDISTNSEFDSETTSRSIISFISTGKLTLKDVCFGNIAVSTNDASDIVRASELAELDISNVYVDTETTTYFPSGNSPECSFMSILKANEDETSYTRSQCGPEPDSSFCFATPPTDSPTPQPITKSPSVTDFVTNAITSTINEAVHNLIDDMNCTSYNIELNSCFERNPHEFGTCQTKHPILNKNILNELILGSSFEEVMREKICPEMKKFSEYCGYNACEVEKAAVLHCHCGDSSRSSGSQNNLLTIIPTILAIFPLIAYLA